MDISKHFAFRKKFQILCHVVPSRIFTVLEFFRLPVLPSTYFVTLFFFVFTTFLVHFTTLSRVFLNFLREIILKAARCCILWTLIPGLNFFPGMPVFFQGRPCSTYIADIILRFVDMFLSKHNIEKN